MRTYEALYIVRPDLKDEEIHAIAQEVETFVGDNGGVIVRSETWGRRRMAYDVMHFTEGWYVLLRFESPPALIARLENRFRLSESVIRHLIVHFDKKTLRLEAEQEQRKRADLRPPGRVRMADDEEEVELVHSVASRAQYDED